MASESSFVSLEVAQSLFESLPPEMQWPTLSPAYVAADVMRDDQSTPVFLVSREGAGFLMHAVHETRVPSLDVSDWQSAYGYGGPIAHHLEGAALTRAWAKFDATAMERKIVAEFVRFHPGAENHRFYTGSVRDDRSVVVIDLTIPDLLASYSGRSRTAIRKADRTGLQVVCESTDCALDRFPDFYRHCMREIGAEGFYLFPDLYFDRLLHLPEARVLSVVNGDERLSMGLFFFGTKRAEYHLSGTLQSARQSGSTNLLIHSAAKLAQSAGCLTLYLGGGTSAQPDDPLLRFKESFAAPSLTFRIGHRIFDSVAYADLRRSFPELAAKSKRILFYRK